MTANESHIDSWYLMDCSFPDLNWARLRLFSSGAAEVFDCDGKTHQFRSLQEAKHWLAEDEFISLDGFDAEDEALCGIQRVSLTPPRGGSDAELQARMYVRANPPT